MTAPDEKTLATLTKLFEEEFGPIGDRQVLYVHAPGRSEISGNHTDHEGGHVIAGSLDVAVDGIAVATDSNRIRVADEGYPTFEITLDTLDVQESEKGTSASLVRGMAHEIAALGVEPHGFDFAFTCSVPSGGGLSSSAAVEAAYGRAMETLWGAPAIEPVTLAQMSQRTENNYYGKPCGLMDQAAVCLGGLAYMDFEDQAQPKTQKLELNFEDHGYALVLVKVGADHVAATDDYAAVPREMQDVAAEFGKARLCEVNVADFDAKLPELRAKLGDRACLRAVHYWYENGQRQGLEGRGKEIYDPESDGWYWLDSDANGAKAVSKDVYQESDGGKWVRYDANGQMIKGWNTNENGTYYFDLITGAMAHGTVEINGKTCHFDEATGILK